MSETQTEQKKKGGPYNKNDKQSRQLEVRRLYFEYGYSAVKISEMMNVNRNTINSDIQYLYSTIRHDDEKISVEDLVNVQLVRFEYQRNRLMEIKDNTQSFKEKIQVERFIFDIDSKLFDMSLKIQYGYLRSWNKGVDFINDWMKKNNKDNRYVLQGSLLATSEEKRNRIEKILEE